MCSIKNLDISSTECLDVLSFRCAKKPATLLTPVVVQMVLFQLMSTQLVHAESIQNLFFLSTHLAEQVAHVNSTHMVHIISTIMVVFFKEALIDHHD